MRTVRCSSRPGGGGVSAQGSLPGTPRWKRTVKMSVGKWIMETTRPHKHVHIHKNQISFAPLCLAWSFPNYILFEIIENFRLYNLL